MRTFAVHRRLLLMLVLGAAAGGCLATEPTTGKTKQTELPDLSTPPDLTPAGPPTPPVLTAQSATSQYTAYPLKGIATPGNTILISGTAVGEVSAEVGPTGTFCALVQLTPNAQTTMTLIALNPEGAMSTPVSFTVTENGTSTPDMGSGIPSKNMALGGTGTTTLDFVTGDQSLMHDGDPGTFLQGNQSQFHETDTVTMQLSQASVIKTIHVRAPSSCPLTAPFQLYVSDHVPSAGPGDSPADWQAVPSMASDGTSTDWVATFATPGTVADIAVYFDRGTFVSGTGYNCASSDATWGALYAFSEIEAWTLAGTAPPPPGAPSCDD
jgi:hypothetical protein